MPLFGTRSVNRVEENLAALNVELSDAEDQEIRAAVDAAEVVGAKYPQAMEHLQLADTVPLKQ